MKPEDPDVNFQLAMAYRTLSGEKEKAEFHLQRALKNESDPAARAELQKKWKALEARPAGEGLGRAGKSEGG